MDILRYFHTLRYLKPVQIYGRLWFRLYRPGPDLSPGPGLRTPRGSWTASCPKPGSIAAGWKFTFLNEVHCLQHKDDWNNPGWEKLWLYNLHYFDDLGSGDAGDKKDLHVDLIHRWIEENPPGTGTGWEPYPLSLRIVNWIKWGLAGNRLPDKALQSLAVQARYLSKRLEFHLLGNHLLANAKALIFSGLFFQGKEADTWLEKGSKILKQQVREQILGDGGHFELSPMYHSVILEDLLDLVNVMQTYGQEKGPAELCRRCIPGMLDWLASMCHPDGRISFFNDAALRIAPDPADLKAYAGRLGVLPGTGPGEGVTLLPDSGYVRVHLGPAVLIADVGRIGPDYLPGHAHADTLSFELSLEGQRVFVNSGVSCYGNSSQRLAQRGTAAHNTVAVNGKNSSDVWGGFRVARRAYPLELRVDELPGGQVRIRCGHDGYAGPGGGPLHRRQWILGQDSLEITDEITRVGGENFDISVYYHLYPGSTADLQKKKIYLGNLRIGFNTDAEIRLEETTFHPEFGKSVPNLCLVLTPKGTACSITFIFKG